MLSASIAGALSLAKSVLHADGSRAISDDIKGKAEGGNDTMVAALIRRLCGRSKRHHGRTVKSHGNR